MKSSDAIVLTVIVMIVVLVIAWYARARASKGDGYCPGPGNINLYDHPYKNYPTYEGRGATWWDGDRHCAAYCGQSPCAVWCR